MTCPAKAGLRLAREDLMAPIRISGLGRKFSALCSYGGYGSIETLAEAFRRNIDPSGKTPKKKTLQYWCSGSATRRPNHLPSKYLNAFRQILSDSLSSHDGELIDNLMYGPPSHLEDALKNDSGPKLKPIILRRLISGRGCVRLAEIAETALAEEELEEAPNDVNVVPLGRRFRIEFNLPNEFDFSFALQTDGKNWAEVRLTVDREQQLAFLPAEAAPGVHGHFAKMDRPANLSFYLFQLNVPPPPVLRHYREERLSLDLPALRRLAESLHEQPDSQFQVLALDVFVRDVRKTSSGRSK